MSRSPEVKERLLRHDVVLRMAVAFQTFSNFDGALEFDADEIRSVVTTILERSQGALDLLIEI
jgi:hypothetical protein